MARGSTPSRSACSADVGQTNYSGTSSIWALPGSTRQTSGKGQHTKVYTKECLIWGEMVYFPNGLQLVRDKRVLWANWRRQGLWGWLLKNGREQTKIEFLFYNLDQGQCPLSIGFSDLCVYVCACVCVCVCVCVIITIIIIIFYYLFLSVFV